MRNLKIGDPKDPDTLVGPMITKAQFDTAVDYIDIAHNEGCRVLTE